MPLYDYACLDCLSKLIERLGREPTDQERAECVFETRLPMNPTPKEVKEACCCPTCGSLDTERLLNASGIIALVRGVNWEEYRRNPQNKSAMRRDMALHQLQTDDPYKPYREPGEVDDLAHRLRSGTLPVSDRP